MWPIWFNLVRFSARMALQQPLRFRVFGSGHVPPRGGALLAANHASFLDPPLVALAAPRQVHFLARDTLFRFPPFGLLISSLGALPIARGSGPDVAGVREAIRIVKGGRLLLVFPEGTRTRDGNIGTIHKGVELISRRAGVPVVPVHLGGTYDAWPRHRRLPRPAAVSVRFGAALPPEPGLAARLAEALRALESQHLRHRKLQGAFPPCRTRKSSTN